MKNFLRENFKEVIIMLFSYKKLIVALVFIAGFATASFAQDEAKMPHPDTKAGSAAWMFEIGGLGPFGMDALYIASFDVTSIVDAPVTPGSFIVLGAGGKYYFSDDLALKAILGFSTSSTGDPDPAKDPNGKTTLTMYGIVAGIEVHTHAVYSTSPYVGAQISFAGLSGKTTVTGQTSENSGSGSAFGIGAVAGFDWYVTNGIAIGGEYMLGFSKSSLSSTSGGTTTDLPSHTNIGISSASAHLVVHM